jgi:hypothetical protein
MKLTPPPKLIPPRQLHQPGRQGEAEDECNEDHHQDAAHILCGGELPAHQDDEDNPEFDHQVGGGQFEDHCRRKTGAFYEEGARESTGMCRLPERVMCACFQV